MPRLLRLYSSPGDEAHIFVHGFQSCRTPLELEGKAAQILNARPRGSVYLLKWDADYKLSKAFEYLAAAASLASTKGASMLPPNLRMLAIGANATGMIIWHISKFRVMERRAEELGRNLTRLLSRHPELLTRRLNFYGHSLGARAIHYGLAYCNWSRYHINNFVMLGGAADLDDDDWGDCADLLNGKLYNAYCPSDGILTRLAYGISLRERVGSQPISIRHNQIINRRYSALGKGEPYWFDEPKKLKAYHSAYWEFLPKILPRLVSDFVQLNYDVVQECPSCEERFVIYPGRSSRLPCGHRME